MSDTCHTQGLKIKLQFILLYKEMCLIDVLYKVKSMCQVMTISLPTYSNCAVHVMHWKIRGINPSYRKVLVPRKYIL